MLLLIKCIIITLIPMVLIVAVPVPGKDISSIYCHTDLDLDVTKEAICYP